MYCEECEIKINEPNRFGDNLCDECGVYCRVCGIYCSFESEDGMCLDCYEDYIDDLEAEEEDYNYVGDKY